MLLLPFKSVIRFGSTTIVDPELIELNSIESVKTSSSKLLMKKAFDNAEIKHPEYYLKSKVPSDVKFPLIGKLVYGSRGRGMVKIDNKEQLDTYLANNKGNKVYLEQYFNGAREYRLHVSDLGCFYSCRKMRKSDAKERWFFNNNNCVWFLEANPKFDKPPTWDDIVKTCIAAKNAVGLDFAAVDVRVSKKGDFRIIETNSAPSLGSVGLERYLDHIPKLLKYKYNK